MIHQIQALEPWTYWKDLSIYQKRKSGLDLTKKLKILPAKHGHQSGLFGGILKHPSVIVGLNMIWLVVGTLFLFFHILGRTIPADFHIFQSGWNHQPVIKLNPKISGEFHTTELNRRWCWDCRNVDLAERYFIKRGNLKRTRIWVASGMIYWEHFGRFTVLLFQQYTVVI